jgi:hypothetical protein
MWLPDNIIRAVDRHARIYYLAKHDTQRWNENRRGPELLFRMLMDAGLVLGPAAADETQ